jgi:integrase/recombinase XerD
VPTIAQIEHVIQAMPANSDIERRNRALIAFALVTGARDSAIASFKLKHIDIAAGKVIQDAREVRTKFSKSFTTVFFPRRRPCPADCRGLGRISNEGQALGAG